MCVRAFTRYTCGECREFYKQEETSEMCTEAKGENPPRMGACGKISPRECYVSDLWCPECEREGKRLLEVARRQHEMKKQNEMRQKQEIKKKKK
ncbi:hypothetical protein ACHAPT_002233 [Fusarium lateritium]